MTAVADGLWNGVRPVPLEVDDCMERPCRGKGAWLQPELRCRALGARYTIPTLHARMTVAIDGCNRCPVLAACREWALTLPDPIPDHTAGGLTSLERRAWRNR
jgi:hypothetical protein